ncbi:MAG: hypothetical protein ACXAB2_16375 [Candidatus Hodarchaeales archaeon]|jgi:hypothetical protein
MTSTMLSNEILVVHQNRIIFSSGKGRLTQHSKISATVTQVLSLFSQKIMEGERIHFIRFENHRMIFLYSQDRQNNDLVAIVLVPIDRSARQVVPTMGIILNLIEQFLEGKVLDAQNRHLDTFYQILTNPGNSLFVIPRTAEGMFSALVLLTAFAHDMRFGVESVVSKLVFIDPSNKTEISRIISASTTSKILSFTPIPGVEENENVLIFGLESTLKQYFSANPGEKVYTVLSRIIGENSNAAKMLGFIDNNDAREIAQSLSMFPPSEDDYIRYNVLLSTVIQPGKDIVVTMSAPVMHKLRDLAPKSREIEPTKIESLLVQPEKISRQPTYPEVSELTTQTLERLQRTREDGLQYKFDDLPIVLDLAPLAMSLSPTKPVPTNDLDITVSLFLGGGNHFVIHVYTHQARLNSIKISLDDIAARIEGKVRVFNEYVSLEGAIDRQKIALRGVLWLSVVEYLTQVEMNIKTLSSRFNVPREGAILIIPPKRDYVREKIPSKFTTFIQESDLREEYETEALWTLGKTLDIILSRILIPLSKGGGVAFVTSESNQEMEEIALFLLLVSEICGIGFSRW